MPPYRDRRVWRVRDAYPYVASKCVLARNEEKRIEEGNIGLCSLAALRRLQHQCLLSQYRRVAIHEVCERPEVVLIQQRNGQLGRALDAIRLDGSEEFVTELLLLGLYRFVEQSVDELISCLHDQWVSLGQRKTSRRSRVRELDNLCSGETCQRSERMGS